MEVYVPRGQAMQAVALVSPPVVLPKKPGSQGTHAVRPVAFPYEPAAQGVHWDAREAPTVAEKVPFGQAMHVPMLV
jgi:hypothetical protein